MDNKEIAKNYVKASINDVELVFYNREQERLKEVKYPFYDGGVSPIVIYYSRKYNLPMVLPTFLKNISGNTIPQISNNFYSSSNSNLGTLNLSMSNPDEDLFQKDYLKNYYFLNKFYNFNIVFVQFKDLYEKKQLNADGIFMWVDELPNLLLSLLILKEKPSLGIKLTDNLESPNSNSVSNISSNININTNSPQTIQKMEDKFSLYYDYIKEITEKYLSNTASKKKEDYLTIFWIYQLLEPTSATIKKEGLENVLDLLKMRGKKKLWNINNPTNTSSTDTQSQVDPQDYKLSWIIYGLIKDYLSLNFDFFLSSYTLNQISKGLVYEGFESLENLNDLNDLEEIEGFTGSQSNKKKVKKSKKDKTPKEKFTDDKKKKVSVWWTLLFCFFILPLFMVIFIKIMMFFWSFSFGLKK